MDNSKLTVAMDAADELWAQGVAQYLLEAARVKMSVAKRRQKPTR